MTQKKKIEVYERVLHNINMFAYVTMDHEAMDDLIRKICNWSYAHRVGNGMLTEKRQKKLIKEAFNKLV